jgi:hypothetical protein
MRKTILAILLSLSLIACGGGGSSSSPPPPAPVSVSISPGSATVAVSASQQFSATVRNTTNTSVTWQVDSIAGGNTTVGTVSASGLYVAPASVPSPSTVTVTAVSVADATKSASATVTITGGGTSISVTVSPTSATVPAGANQQFTATVSNTNNTAVTWQVNGIVAGNGTVGSISSSGLYTAPLAPPAAGKVTVTAISQADSSKSASATVVSTFSNASLSGSFVFKAVVVDNSSFTFTGGVFDADGNGNLSNGIEDVNDSVFGPNTGISFVGNYTVGPDGRGTATASSSFSTSTFKFVLSSTTSGQLIEFDSFATSSGFILAQDTSAIANVSGTFVFNLQGADIAPGFIGPLSSVGQVQLDGFGNASGIEDLNDAGSIFTNVSFGGSYSVGSRGRGTAILTSGVGSSNYVFYIVDANTIEFLNLDSSGFIETGTARAQSNTTFSNSALPASAFLVSGGDTSTGAAFVAAGRFDTNGAGSIQNGILDENDNGFFFDGVPFTGSYSIAPNGRGTASVTTSFGTSTFIFWMSAPGFALFMEADPLAAASGVAFAQQGAPFSNSSIIGNFAFTLAGAAGSSPFAAVGRVVSNGAGGLTGVEDFNVGGSVASNVSLSGTYSIAASGRGTSSVTGVGTLPVRLYLISPVDAIFVSADPAEPVIGLTIKQCSDCH